MAEDGAKHLPVCLTIGGLDPSGGAGIVADIDTFSKLGCVPAAVVTSVTFQNADDFFGTEHQSAFSVHRQIEPILNERPIAAVKIGMLPTPGIVRTVAALARDRSWKCFVIDPVIRSTSGGELMEDGALKLLLKLLLPLATLITPNLSEAEQITRTKIASIDDIHRAASLMRSMGALNVLIKGGHRFEGATDAATDYLFGIDGACTFRGDWIENADARGTGCRLASAIAANLSLGHDLTGSVQRAKDFVAGHIANASAEAIGG